MMVFVGGMWFSDEASMRDLMGDHPFPVRDRYTPSGERFAVLCGAQVVTVLGVLEEAVEAASELFGARVERVSDGRVLWVEKLDSLDDFEKVG